jgi:RNA 2',3'-cyclic 3'-phosphodiesterase
VRTFVAAWPDDATRQQLAALELGREKNLRLVGPTRWHVTLRFLGEVTEAQLEALGDALQAGAAALPGPAQCHLGPATAWFSRVRVLQLPADGLGAVAAAVRRATAPVVTEPPGGDPPFNGHLTLARVKGRLGPLAQAGLEGIPFTSTFAVAHIDLVGSVPSPEGHVYTTLARATLGNPA